MKTSLDHLPAKKQRELERVVEILFKEFEQAHALVTSTRKRQGRILKIILFGSYARGGWVDEPHTAKGYLSDYDLLIIVNQKELTDFADYWYTAEDRLIRETAIKPPVNFIVHTLDEVNSALAKGQYFFSDIRNEGVALYELKGHKLAEAKPLTPKEALKIASGYFDKIFPSSVREVREFEFYFKESAKDPEYRKNAVFTLHQAAEQAYNCLLLVATNYTPSTHNIKFLRSLVEDLDRRLIDAWPHEHKQDRSRFELLKRAYVEARYSEHFEISAEELEWLGGRVKDLQALVETTCQERL